VSENVADVFTQPPSGLSRVEFRLDDDPPADDVQAAGEPQRGRDLRLATARLGHLQPAEFVLDQCR
jgi:hypothetical protein